jgi:hypothetical protein
VRFIDTAFYAISIYTGGYNFNIPSTYPGLYIWPVKDDGQPFLKLTFTGTGTLEQSTDGINWESPVPPPESPWLMPADKSVQLFQIQGTLQLQGALN